MIVHRKKINFDTKCATGIVATNALENKIDYIVLERIEMLVGKVKFVEMVYEVAKKICGCDSVFADYAGNSLGDV